MRRLIKCIDLLDEPADALVYSTNVLLNCSGGVGAALMARYGTIVQEDLHQILADRGHRFVQRGEVLEHVSAGMPYKCVYHTVPSDGFYDTTPEIVQDVLRQALRGCCESGDVSSVVMSALATGFGHLQFEDFFGVAAPVLVEEEFASLERITICVELEYSFELAKKQVAVDGLPLEVVPR